MYRCVPPHTALTEGAEGVCFLTKNETELLFLFYKFEKLLLTPDAGACYDKKRSKCGLISVNAACLFLFPADSFFRYGG